MQNRSSSLTIVGYGLSFLSGLGFLIYLTMYIVSYINPEMVMESSLIMTPERIALSRGQAMVWVLCLLNFIGYLGVLRLKEWGRELVVFMSGVTCLLFIGNAFITQGINALSIVAILIFISIILFFMQPHIRKEFKTFVPSIGKKILVIDDDRGFLKMVDSFLHSKGFDTLLAPTGEKGVQLAKAKTPDLILLDVILPGIKGRDVCARLKEDEKTKDIPVIFLTAKDSPDDVKAELELGAVSHLTKPVDLKKLLAETKIILDIHF